MPEPTGNAAVLLQYNRARFSINNTDPFTFTLHLQIPLKSELVAVVFLFFFFLLFELRKTNPTTTPEDKTRHPLVHLSVGRTRLGALIGSRFTTILLRKVTLLLFRDSTKVSL